MHICVNNDKINYENKGIIQLKDILDNKEYKQNATLQLKSSLPPPNRKVN